ncbi:fungal-specific transcription factor domain-containing protein [Fusarium solani]|uniref:Fungal-specific transcription factor domain-containing protein n=1 Tax=Fusarium solani TaxID=169388 RepID=A0A9P9G1S3_FUSSL|nr:fungal-specific transcription factor domain-containing protein [Fusarium solani]KAH7230387.1 fungal-specific transcription factor domain-containing protein [Fusarium solani]
MPPTPRRRGRTFTGCWTCRERRVKCDENRPACSRCLSAGRTCQGYHLKLSWVTAHGAIERAPRAASQASAPETSERRTPAPSIQRPMQQATHTSGHRLLLHHWSTYLCDAFMPLSSVNNPLRPLTAIVDETHAAEGNPASLAILHMLCASSATHLARAGVADLELDATQHENLAFLWLRRALKAAQEGEGGMDPYRILAAITLCVVHESIKGTSSLWRIHIHAGLRWLRNCQGSLWRPSESCMALYHLFLAFLSAALVAPPCYGDSFSPNPEDYQALTTCAKELGHMIGVQAEVVLALVSACREVHGHGTEARQRHCALWTITQIMPPPPPPPADAAGTARQQKLRFHHESICYYAVQVLVRRSLGRVPTEQIQDLVQHGVDHMEGFHSLNIPASVPVWPIQVISCNAMDRATQCRILGWLASPRSREFEVWEKVAALASSIWELKKQCDWGVGVDWQDITPFLLAYDVPMS